MAALTSDSSPDSLNPLAPPFLSNPSQDIRSLLIKDLKGLSNTDSDSCHNIADLSLYLLKSIHMQEAKIARLESDARPVQSQIRDLEHQISLLTHENLLLRQQIALVEDASRILTLRVEGLQEKTGENLITYVASTLSRTGVSCSYEDIDYAKRIGKFKPGQTRPILVKFIKESKRNLILYNRANLNRNANTLVWINDDISDFTRRQRKTVREIAAYAKSQGISELKIHGDGLIINNNKYKHQDLDLLPAHLSIANAKQIADENDLYFQSEHSPLSNFYACPIYDNDDICYISAEQIFQHKKAIHHNFQLTADKILLTRDPYEIKRLGNLIPTSQTWLEKEESVMEEILQLKFSQNPILANTLIATGDLHLHEATADRKWSTGAELSSKAILNGDWQGSDMMGTLLEKIRSQLRGDSNSDPEILPPQSSPPPLEDDDILPMPDQDEENTAPDPLPPAPNQTTNDSSLQQAVNHSPNSLNTNNQNTCSSPTYSSKLASPAPPSTHSHNTHSCEAKAIAIQPLMQCHTTLPKPSIRAPSKNNNNSRSPKTRSTPPPRPPPPTQTPTNKQQHSPLGAKSENPAQISNTQNKNLATSDRAPVRRSSRPSLPTTRFSQQ